jgi:hypothetical protein
VQASHSKFLTRSILALALAAGFAHINIAGADDWERREHERHLAGEPYRSPHWIYDDRYHHRHYYPAVGYSVDFLPSGFATIGFGGRRMFFQSGVWYESVGPRYVVARPPVGIVVPVLPPDYSTVYVGGVPYYYANEIYYTGAPGSYVVATPPAAGTYVEQPQTAQAPQAPPAPATPAAPPAPAAPAAAPAAAGATWYYCDSSKSYYPYVASCKEGWKPVPASAPPQ